MRLNAMVPAPPTAGPPLVLAATAIADAVPLAMICDSRQTPMRMLPCPDVSVGRAAALAPAA